MSNRVSFPIVVSAPSGTGKTTLCRAVARTDARVRYSVSCTTRRRRKGEVNGRDYRFLGLPTFKRWIEEKRFAEWAVYQNSYYGTLIDEFRSLLDAGFDVIADLNTPGAEKLMDLYPDGVFIYVLPPSRQELMRRLKSRNSDAKDEAAKRLLNAEEELSHAGRYEYMVVNEEFDKTVEAIVSIIKAERLKSKRLQEPLDIIKWRN
jgi:guanylate kinase